jgi:hypothetical protein
VKLRNQIYQEGNYDVACHVYLTIMTYMADRRENLRRGKFEKH